MVSNWQGYLFSHDKATQATSQVASQDRLQGVQHELLWLEIGAASECRYPDQERWHSLHPGAIGEYQAGECRVHYWLEWDRATVGTRDLVAKFRTYAHYVTSHEWFRDKEIIPYLLMVVPGKEQEIRIVGIAEAVLVDAAGLAIRTTTAT